MYELMFFMAGAIAGYAFRGLIHKEIVKYGAVVETKIAAEFAALKAEIAKKV
jgi:hypothetical protein